MSLSEKKIIPLVLIIVISALAIIIIQTDNVDAKTKKVKMTVYDCVKTGDMVYCTTGITSSKSILFKIDLTTQKVTRLDKKKRGYINDLKVKGNYLYYTKKGWDYDPPYLYRINLKTEKKKRITGKMYYSYAIKGSKIYYTALKSEKYGDWSYHNRVMKLNGKSKKSTKHEAKNKYKKTNNKNYRIVVDWYDDDTANYYLKTPGGNIFLESIRNDWN